ncbi:hypothetical protein I203_106969 [Kwoniella mangroviensis CBS 8507]|uniref:hypothetical protein n=1 Tax=Kwoniella mangroviensis CBS 8507 TaxID=1296122 RepID=UPI00080CE90C|nr:uncharacterized protein I203_08115 [Kwoniella mangroviensis CBS 8507]OCF62800.1 hypothetical protein I203_08115 [Kwoniella mangroviensis CBS 8507]
MGPKRKRSRRSTTTSAVYNREDADLELSSNDNTIFKVDSFYLKAHSEVFRNMFTDQLFTNSTIPIDLSSKDLTCLLDIMVSGEPPEKALSLKQVKTLYAFCDQYECPFIRQLMISQFKKVADIEPWDTFILASQHKDVDLAKQAIKSIAKFKDKHLISAGNMPLSMAETIDISFLLPLLEQVQAHSAQIYTIVNGYAEGQVREVWAKIAKDFQPRE